MAQDIFIGGNILADVASNTGVGLSINGEYQFREIPISIRLSAKTYTGSFKGSPYLNSYYHLLKTIETNILYRFSDEMVRPYFGLGTGYTSVYFDKEGLGLDVDNCGVLSKDPENSINYNFLAGISLFSQDFFSFYVEFFYRIININYISELECIVEESESGVVFNDFTIPQSVLLKTFLLNVGFRLRLY